MTDPSGSKPSDAPAASSVASADCKANAPGEPAFYLARGPAVAGAGAETPFTEEHTADVAAHIDDPCDEGGYDQFCRDRGGALCAFHEQHCHAPDYPCLDLLRHHLAVVFLEDVTTRRRARRALENSGGASND